LTIFAQIFWIMNWRKTLISIAVIVVLFVISFLLYGLFAGMAEPSEKLSREEIKLFVKAENVSYTTNKAKVIETGRLSSQHTVDLSSEVQGEILQGDVRLREGTRFSKGTLLVRIFDQEARNNLKASKSRFLNAIASILPDIKIDYPDSYGIYEKFFNDVDINKPLPPLPKIQSEPEKIFLASRNILNDYFTIKSAEIRLGKYKLYAPFDGTFTQVYLEPGAIANPGSRIASMIRTDKLELEVPVRIADAYWIEIGDKVIVETKDHNQQWTGTVIRKSNFMDPATQTVMVYVALSADKKNPLYQGQYLRAEFETKTLENCMVIPRNAVFDKNFVFVVEDGRLKKEAINILKTGETTLIFSGLPEGAVVVTEPLVNGREGVQAEIIE
jgi:membrane fusion protein, multidrug efflux system